MRSAAPERCSTAGATLGQAKRQARYRERVKDGRRVLRVDVDEVKLAALLIEAGYLHRSDEDNLQRLQAALSLALDSMRLVND